MKLAPLKLLPNMSDLHHKELNIKVEDRHYTYIGQHWQNEVPLQKEETLLQLQFFLPLSITY